MRHALALIAAALAIPAAQAETVQTATGAVAGTTTATVSEFLGIPYAAPPTGVNRWRAPQPAAAWTGVRDATHYGNDCSQAPFPPDAAPIRTTPSEDCLYLNVWKPASAKPGAKLPVMAWVHGGGFVNGGTSPAIYSGVNFARDGVVMVSLNYRLGRFGFFAHPGLAAEGFGGNFGFLDQIAALKWVQANVAAFGGDPAQVTIFGESAGGMSMHMLLQSPLARGLFVRAIVESGGGRNGTLPQPTLAGAAIKGSDFAPGLSADQLRALPAEKITGNLSMMTMGQPGYSGPMVDGRTIVGAPDEAARAGLDANVPVIIGANSADGFPMQTDKAKIFAAYGTHEAEARAIYDPAGTLDGMKVATATSADRMMIEPARAVARSLALHQSVWLYRFAYGSGKFAELLGGAPHASEIPFAFDTVTARAEPSSPADIAVAKRMHALWVNFAKTGNPGADWPNVTATDTTVHLITTDGAKQAEDPYRARLDFAESLAH